MAVGRRVLAPGRAAGSSRLAQSEAGSKGDLADPGRGVGRRPGGRPSAARRDVWAGGEPNPGANCSSSSVCGTDFFLRVSRARRSIGLVLRLVDGPGEPMAALARPRHVIRADRSGSIGEEQGFAPGRRDRRGGGALSTRLGALRVRGGLRRAATGSSATSDGTCGPDRAWCAYRCPDRDPAGRAAQGRRPGLRILLQPQPRHRSAHTRRDVRGRWGAGCRGRAATGRRGTALAGGWTGLAARFDRRTNRDCGARRRFRGFRDGAGHCRIRSRGGCTEDRGCHLRRITRDLVSSSCCGSQESPPSS